MAFAILTGLAFIPSAGNNLAFAKAFRETPEVDPNQQQDPNTIVIPAGAGDKNVPGGNYFQPATANVPSGAKVTWINRDAVPHTATAGDPTTGNTGEFDTGLFSTGKSASVTVTSEGTIQYYCTVHPWMVGTLNVGASSGQPQTQKQAPTSETQTANATQTANTSSQQPAAPTGGQQALQAILDAAKSLQQAIDALERAAGGAQQPAATSNATQTAGQAQPSSAANATNAAPPGGQQNQAQQAGNATQNATAPAGGKMQGASNATQTNATQQTSTAGSQAFVETHEDQFAKYLRTTDAPLPRVTTSFPGKSANTTQELPSVNQTETGTEQKHEDNWITANHDMFGTRWTNQTTINKDNIDQLEVKWIYTNDQKIEDPPIIINDTAYFQDNNGLIMALDADTGLMKWKIDTGDGGLMHGLTYDHGVIFSGTGANATIIAINPENGDIYWESPPLGPSDIGYNIPAVPLVWKDIVIAGSAGGDLPTNPGVVQGNVTGLDRRTGEILWSIKTTAGDWVSPDKIPPNGGGTSWSSFSFDPETGLLYAPIGNATPDFNAKTRIDSPNWYMNTVMAINVTNGQMKWATPFVAAGSVIDVAIPDTHDWDVAFGTSFSKVTMENGTVQKVVIGHDKMGNIIAMDAETGDELWWKTLGTIYRPNAVPRPEGGGMTFPGSSDGVENWHAVDNDTVYVSTTSMGFEYFTQGVSGYAVPVVNSTKSGYGNGTVWALDLLTGDVKWRYDVDFPTKTSALVTNDLVFAGHMTSIGTPYESDTFGAPSSASLFSSGIIMALDKETGKKLWEFNVGDPIGVGGPSIGNGMLYVPTGSIHVPSKSGSIVAFGLPDNETTDAAGMNESQVQLPAGDAGRTANATGSATNSTLLGQMEPKTRER